jgi:hypothetical protein
MDVLAPAAACFAIVVWPPSGALLFLGDYPSLGTISQNPLILRKAKLPVPCELKAFKPGLDPVRLEVDSEYLASGTADCLAPKW